MFDVLVVGGGVAGTYAAWRLASDDALHSDVVKPLAMNRADGRPRIALCEQSDRIGGRLYSVVPQGMPHLRAELGGMRFLTTHTFEVKLVEHLGLTVDVFPMGDNNNRFYLRGEGFTARDWENPDLVKYHLPDRFRGKSPDELLDHVIRTHAKHPETMSPHQWHAFRQDQEFEGRALYDWGFWNLLMRDLGAEGYNLVRDGMGYYSFLSNWSAAEAIPFLWEDFRLGVKYLTLRDGYQQLPEEMARRFTEAGGILLKQHRLRSLTRPASGDNDTRIELRFERGDGDDWTCFAHHVVLALPRRAIELLDQVGILARDDDNEASREFRQAVESVIPSPAAKAFLGYREPWWEGKPLHLRSGRSVTDLPLRQCFYFGAEGDKPGAHPNNRNALLLASYCDGIAVDFWRGLEASPPVPGDVTVPLPMIVELTRQLQELHGLDMLPEPYMGLFIDWTQDPYGGAYHFWDIHAKSWEVIDRMRQPFRGINVYICGEAWSTNQGWVAGALNTTEQMLVRRLGMPHPSWFPHGYHLGF